MSTGKSARRAAVALAVSLGTFAYVIAAEQPDAPRPASSALTNSVVVESQILITGTPGTVVGVSVSNAVPLAGLLVPLEIRPLTPGAAIAESIAYVMNPAGRVANSPLGFADDVDSLWPEALRVVRRTCQVCPSSCSGPVSNSYCSDDISCTYPTGPYGLFFGTVSTGDTQSGHLIEMAAGADPGDAAAASLQIVLTHLGTMPGIFEVDTACWTPANSLAYVQANSQLIVPSFTKGTIELRCDCGCHGDPFCDGILNIQDVVSTIDVAFRNGTPVAQPYCPRQATDLNCDGIVNIQDIVIMLDVTFRGQDPDQAICNPCAL